MDIFFRIVLFLATIFTTYMLGKLQESINKK
jgi:hypothetical protein